MIDEDLKLRRGGRREEGDRNQLTSLIISSLSVFLRSKGEIPFRF